MQASRLQKTLKFIRRLLLIALAPLFLTAAFSYLCYKLLAIDVCILVVLWLISRFRASRHKVLKYRWGAFIGIAILCTAFMVSPEFNFLLTFPARQQIVNHFIETHKPSQYDVPISTALLGKTTGNIGPNSKNVAIYFRYYGVVPAVGERAFIIFTTRPIAKIENLLYAKRGTAKQLKENWFFIQAKPIGFN